MGTVPATMSGSVEMDDFDDEVVGVTFELTRSVSAEMGSVEGG